MDPKQTPESMEMLYNLEKNINLDLPINELFEEIKPKLLEAYTATGMQDHFGIWVVNVANSGIYPRLKQAMSRVFVEMLGFIP